MEVVEYHETVGLLYAMHGKKESNANPTSLSSRRLWMKRARNGHSDKARRTEVPRSVPLFLLTLIIGLTAMLDHVADLCLVYRAAQGA